VAFVSVAPANILERLGTIGDTQESSASARLTAWGTALRMIEDNPMLGVGLRNFQSRYVDYSLLPPDQEQATYVAHNSYLQVWAESGTPAFVVYLALLASVFLVCRKVHALGRSRPDLAWAANYARMMEATMIGFMVGAFFLNRGHFDLTYHWLALASCLGGVAFAAARSGPAVQRASAARGRVEVRSRGARPALPAAAAAAGAGQVVWSRGGRWR
jgi:O-antigen ligase